MAFGMLHTWMARLALLPIVVSGLCSGLLMSVPHVQAMEPEPEMRAVVLVVADAHNEIGVHDECCKPAAVDHMNGSVLLPGVAFTTTAPVFSVFSDDVFRREPRGRDAPRGSFRYQPFLLTGSTIKRE